ncbi:MAG: signal peptidase II [Corallococcus sp.]|nr:signal peptidase II [Corallococcus sp.]
MKRRISVLGYISIYISVIIVSVIIDQVTKVIMGNVLSDGKVINIIGNWLVFQWTLNPGAAFGGFKGASIWFFITTLIGLPLFAYLLWRARTRSVLGQIGFAFIIGGTIGNAIDRMFLGDGFFNGKVRDFISVKGFAIFNVADSFLVIGVIFACIALLVLDSDAVFRKQPTVREVADETMTHSADITDADLTESKQVSEKADKDETVDD